VPAYSLYSTTPVYLPRLVSCPHLLLTLLLPRLLLLLLLPPILPVLVLCCSWPCPPLPLPLQRCALQLVLLHRHTAGSAGAGCPVAECVGY